MPTFGHVAVLVSDLERSTRFYKAALVEHTQAFVYRGDFSKNRDDGHLPRRRMNVATAEKDLAAGRARATELNVDLAVTARVLGLLPTIWAVPGS